MFNEEDRALHRGLIKIINSGTYPLKADEINNFAAIHTWLMELGKKECPKCAKRMKAMEEQAKKDLAAAKKAKKKK